MFYLDTLFITNLNMYISKHLLSILIITVIYTQHQQSLQANASKIINHHVHRVVEADRDLCQVSCVKNIYDVFCGGAQCVYGTSTDEELNALCSSTCIQALSGDIMTNCLYSTNLNPTFNRNDAKNILVHQVQSIIFKTK